jgi:hypothetical protein
VFHTGGAAALAVVLAHLLARAHVQPAAKARAARSQGSLRPAV